MQTHLEPHHNHGEGQHGRVTVCSFLVAGRHAAQLFQAVDQPLHRIALPVERSVQRSGRLFVLLPRDRGPNASPLQVSPVFPERIAFIAPDPLGTDA